MPSTTSELVHPNPTDSSAIANQESLSLLEVEMRKLEAVVKEIVDEMGYLQRREMRMRDTNGEFGKWAGAVLCGHTCGDCQMRWSRSCE